MTKNVISVQKIWKSIFFCIGFFCQGCQHETPPETSLAGSWALKAQRHSQHIDITFNGQEKVLSRSEKHKIKYVLESLQKPFPLYVRVHVFSASEKEKKCAQDRIQNLKKYLESLGMMEKNIEVEYFHFPQTQGEGGHTFMVIFDQYEAVMPSCASPWEGMPHESGINGEARFGCASAANLAIMISDPRDIYKGRKLAPPEGIAAVDAIDRYRARQATGQAAASEGTTSQPITTK